MNHAEWRQKVEEIICALGGSIDWSGRTHAKATFRNGRTVTVAKTPSDFRAIKNFQSLCERESGNRLERQNAGKLKRRRVNGFSSIPATEKSGRQSRIDELWQAFLEVDHLMQLAAGNGNQDEFVKLNRRWSDLSDSLYELGVDSPSEWQLRVTPPRFVRRTNV